MCPVCRSLFILPFDAIVRLCCVIVALDGRFLYCFLYVFVIKSFRLCSGGVLRMRTCFCVHAEVVAQVDRIDE